MVQFIYMKLNKDRCHFLVANNKDETLWANAGCSKIWESQHENFLEVIINRNLNSNDNVLSISVKKTGKKLSVLSKC